MCVCVLWCVGVWVWVCVRMCVSDSAVVYTNINFVIYTFWMGLIHIAGNHF